MSSEAQWIDPVEVLLAATFGPGIAAEVAREPDTHKVVTPVVSPSWPLKLDGTPRKKCQKPMVTGLMAAKVEATTAEVVRALNHGAESVADLRIATGFAKLTIVRSLERLLDAGLVTVTTTPTSGKRGRPAHLYRPVVEVVGGTETQEADLRSAVEPTSPPTTPAACNAADRRVVGQEGQE
jgi:predicted transcriptional regulator